MKVLIGGFFDIIHLGHIFALRKAKALGNYLIVNISPDIRAREKKGIGRTFFPERQRAELVKSIKWVDETTIIESEPNVTEDGYQIKYIGIIKPDVFVSSKQNKKVSSFCKKNKIKFVVIPPTAKIHSTDLINEIKNYEI